MSYGTLSYSGTDQEPKAFTLRSGGMTIGRAPENDIVLTDAAVARVHVRLIAQNDGAWVIDLGSATGTFLNQIRLRQNMRYPLRDGDSLRVGATVFHYSLPTPWFRERSGVVPPDVAATLSGSNGPVDFVPGFPHVRRLRGNGGPPLVRPELLHEHAISSYLQYLPPCYHDDEFLGRFLLIFESILMPIERTVDQIHNFFDPLLAPESLLPWLASWLDLVLNEKWNVEQRRLLIHAAPELYRWRGTRRGLKQAIQIYTGVEPTIIEAGHEVKSGPLTLPAHVFRVVLEVAEPEQFDAELVAALIEAGKPAHTAYQLEIRQPVLATA